jgi:hypothetical protein
VFWQRGVPVLSHVTVIFLSPIVVLTPKRAIFWFSERYEDLSLFTLYELFYSSSTMQRESTVALPWQQSKVMYCCKRHVAKLYKGKALSRLQGSIFKGFTSLSDKNVHNVHRMRRCVTKAIMLTQMCHSITLHINSLPCALRRKPAVADYVAHHNNLYVRNMTGFDTTEKLWVLGFDCHYCNDLTAVLTKATIETNYDKYNQCKGIPVLYHQYVKYQSSVNHNKWMKTREHLLCFSVNYIPCRLFRKALII